MRSYPKFPPEESEDLTASNATAPWSNTNSCQSTPPFLATAKLHKYAQFYRGDPELMDDVNLLNTNPERCLRMFGTREVKLERKIYFFDKLDVIRVLRDPTKEIDVVQYEYPSGSVCYLVCASRGMKEELIKSGFLYVHECLMGSPLKVFVDIDCQPPEGISVRDYNALLVRVKNWIVRFQHEVQKSIEGIMLASKKSEKVAKVGKKKKKTRKATEAKHFRHEWSVQTANRPPSQTVTKTKISFHVINNSFYKDKPIFFADVVHLDEFLRRYVLKFLDAPDGFKVDGTFTYLGKSIRCFGAAKRCEPGRVFVESVTPGRPFGFYCVQPDSLDGEHYVIRTVAPSTLFDSLYPETGFVQSSTSSGRGGGGGAPRGISNCPCNMQVPLEPSDRETLNSFIRSVALYLQDIRGHLHIATVTKNKTADNFPYKTQNAKRDQDNYEIDIAIAACEGTYCFLGPRQHGEGKRSSPMQVCLRKDRYTRNLEITVRCRGDKSPDHPCKRLNVSALTGGLQSKRAEMLDFARAVEKSFLDCTGDAMEDDEKALPKEQDMFADE